MRARRRKRKIRDSGRLTRLGATQSPLIFRAVTGAGGRVNEVIQAGQLVMKDRLVKGVIVSLLMQS